MTERKSNPLEAAATAEDIGNCYRILLDREAESSAVIREKVGQRRLDVLNAFLTSSEFGAGTLSHICQGTGDTNVLRETTVGASSLQWAVTLFDVDEPARRNARTSRLRLLSAIAAHPVVEKTLDRTYGDGTTARLILSSSGIMARPPSAAIVPPGPPFTTPRDRELSHRLLLDQMPANPPANETRTPVFETVALILNSPEFRRQCVEPALSGQLTRDHSIDGELTEWVATTFDVDQHRNRFKAIAEILNQAMIRKRLNDFAVDWPIDKVVNALQCTILDGYSLEDCLARQEALNRRLAA